VGRPPLTLSNYRRRLAVTATVRIVAIAFRVAVDAASLVVALVAAVLLGATHRTGHAADDSADGGAASGVAVTPIVADSANNIIYYK